VIFGLIVFVVSTVFNVKVGSGATFSTSKGGVGIVVSSAGVCSAVCCASCAKSLALG